jgi:hypothetical protein
MSITSDIIEVAANLFWQFADPAGLVMAAVFTAARHAA